MFRLVPLFGPYQPCSQGLSSAHPKGREGRKTLFGLVTCLDDKFILSPLVFVTYKTSPLSNHGKLSFNFSAKICHVYYIVSTLLSKDKNVKLKRVVIFDTRYTTLLLALSMAWVYIKFTDWVVYRKRPGRIKWSKEVTFVFPFRTDWKWINKTRRQKNI